MRFYLRHPFLGFDRRCRAFSIELWFGPLESWLVGASYREIDFEDAAHASDIMTAAYPPMPQDPVITEWRWRTAREDYRIGRFIASEGGRDVAFLAWFHGPWAKLPDRHCEVEVWLDRNAMDRDLLREMWAWIGGQAEADGAGLLLAYAGEDEPEALEVLNELGYERARTEKVWELDLKTHGPRLAAEAAEERLRMAKADIKLLTFADWADPEKEQKLYELNSRTVQDVPHTLPILTESFADFVKRVHTPDRPLDRFWIAVHGDQAVGMSYLKFPPVRGTVWTGYTCTDSAFRGRGIARAVKLQSLAQAVQLGIPIVCTDNDSENAPMLHINETLGYHRRPGFVEHHKRVTT